MYMYIYRSHIHHIPISSSSLCVRKIKQSCWVACGCTILPALRPDQIPRSSRWRCHLISRWYHLKLTIFLSSKALKLIQPWLHSGLIRFYPISHPLRESLAMPCSRPYRESKMTTRAQRQFLAGATELDDAWKTWDVDIFSSEFECCHVFILFHTFASIIW